MLCHLHEMLPFALKSSTVPQETPAQIVGLEVSSSSLAALVREFLSLIANVRSLGALRGLSAPPIREKKRKKTSTKMHYCNDKISKQEKFYNDFYFFIFYFLFICVKTNLTPFS